VHIRECHLTIEPIQKVIARLTENIAVLDARSKRSLSSPRLLLRDNGQSGAVAVLFLGLSVGSNIIAALSRWLSDSSVRGWQIRVAHEPEARRWKSKIIAQMGDCSLSIEVADRQIALDVMVFTQVNRQSAAQLVNHVMEIIPPSAYLLDLYGGYGAFALAHASRGGRALVVEASSEAVRDGRAGAAALGLEVRYQQADLGFIRKNYKWDDYDAVVLDPPRAGLHRQALDWLNRSGPPLVVYISCHPAALARDIKGLTNYRPDSFQPVDMFPMTPDVEIAATLRRH
jgi:23S rRNA (uracil1939-C5)-methyltransferase